MIERHASQDEIEQMIREHKLSTYEAYRTSTRYTSHSTAMFATGENGRDKAV
jgi:hypothetical protein